MIEESVVLVLAVVSLGWLVACWLYMKLFELLSGVFLLLALLLLFLLFGLLLHLPFNLFLALFLLSECLKHILIVEESVRELVLEVFVVEELRNPSLNNGHLQDSVDRGSLCRVLLQQCRY